MQCYGCNICKFWSPLKNRIRTPPKIVLSNFAHPVSESWLTPCINIYAGFRMKVITFLLPTTGGNLIRSELAARQEGCH